MSFYDILQTIKANLNSKIYVQFNNQDINTENIYLISPGSQTIKVSDIKDENMIQSGYGSYTEKKTKHDLSVRNSLELNTNNLYFLNNNNYIHINNIFDQQLYTYREEISKFLNRSIYIVPYKLIKYNTNHFFKKHVDSLKKKNIIGTLLFVLNNNFEGGSFIISHKDNTYNIDFNNGNILFFFGTCPHEVLPITKGHRFVITFDVYLQNEDMLLYDIIDMSCSEKFDMFFKKIVEYIIDHNEINNICIELDHRYATGFPNEDCDLENEYYNPRELKGNDVLLYNYLKNKINNISDFITNDEFADIRNIFRLRNIVDRNITNFNYKIPDSTQLNPYITGFYLYYSKFTENMKDNICRGCITNKDQNHVLKTHSDDYVKYISNEDLFITDTNKWYCTIKNDNDYTRDYYIGNEYCDEYYNYGLVFIIIDKIDLLKIFS